jgi:hypothetical protein
VSAQRKEPSEEGSKLRHSAQKRYSIPTKPFFAITVNHAPTLSTGRPASFAAMRTFLNVMPLRDKRFSSLVFGPVFGRSLSFETTLSSASLPTLTFFLAGFSSPSSSSDFDCFAFSFLSPLSVFDFFDGCSSTSVFPRLV